MKKNGSLVKCAVCGKEKYFNKSMLEKGKGKYCSKRCYDIAITKTMPIKEELCRLYIECRLTQREIGKIYNVSSSCVGGWLKKYDIKIIKGKRNKTGKIVKCQICGKEIYVVKSNLARGRGNYCSRECTGIANREKRLNKSIEKVQKKFGMSIKKP